MKKDEFFEYLLETFGKEKPIFIKDIQLGGMSEASVKMKLKRLCEKGLLRKETRGVYYIPEEDNEYNLPSLCPGNLIIKKKYLSDGEKIYGYYGGTKILNMAGISTQVPGVRTIVTNKETTNIRWTRVGDFKIILKKPYYPIDNDNYAKLQFLELLRSMYEDEDIEKYQEYLFDYLETYKFELEDLEEYLSYFPKKVFRRYKILEGLKNEITRRKVLV